MTTDFNCNKVYFSALMPKVAPVAFKGLAEVLERYGVPYGMLEGTKDIWCRDYMPVQVAPGRFAAFKYEPDYLRNFKKYKPTITDGNAVAKAQGYNLEDALGEIRLDGGNVVRCGGKVVMTAKVFEENPGCTARELSALLEEAFAAEVIFVPWDVREYYGHSDGICRDLGDDRLLMTNYRDFDKKMGDRFLNCLEHHFKEVVELKYEVETPYKENWAYINWLQTDKVLILPSFGVPEDAQALHQVETLLPAYRGRIEQVDACDLIPHEGCFNCATWTVQDP